MDITTLNSAARPTGASGTPRSDYQTFLTMLTVQMQNQDPLNPTQASDFAVQLATFSNVEQQTYTNQLLSALLGQTGLADLGSWVGMEARLFSGAWFDGGTVNLSIDPALGADQATLVVRDSTAEIVDSIALHPDAQAYTWDGRTGAGTTLDEGLYTFELVSSANGTEIDTQPVAAYLPILEARHQGGSTLLVLPGGLLVDSAHVSGLRQPRD